MERRNFIELSLAGIGAGFISSGAAVAESKEKNPAGGIFYTKDNPGRWDKKISGHLPSIKIAKSSGGAISVEVVTAHGMGNYQHYIVKHVLLDKNYNFLAENMFDPIKDNVPISTFKLKGYKGKVYVLSMCNKHDVWLNEASI